MKYIVILSMLLLGGCSKPKDAKTFTAYSCNRGGCTLLMKFSDLDKCIDFKGRVIHTDKLNKNKITKFLTCQEDFK